MQDTTFKLTDKFELTYEEFGIVSLLFVQAGQMFPASDPEDVAIWLIQRLQIEKGKNK